MSNVFFTSDLHLGHTTSSMLEFREKVHGVSFSRPEYHDEWIISNMNKVVGRRDHLWILGDVAFGSRALHLLSAINGTKSLVFGNHDKLPTLEYMKYFNKLHGLMEKYDSIFSHCPLYEPELAFRNWCLNVHGHIHHKERQPASPRYFNVNIDVKDCTPVPLEEIKEARVKAGEYFESVIAQAHN